MSATSRPHDNKIWAIIQLIEGSTDGRLVPWTHQVQSRHCSLDALRSIAAVLDGAVELWRRRFRPTEVPYRRSGIANVAKHVSAFVSVEHKARENRLQDSHIAVGPVARRSVRAIWKSKNW